MTLAAITTWPSLTSTTGKVFEGDWDKLLAAITRWRPFAGDLEHPGWSGAIFDPCERGNDNVKFMTALVLDYDGTSSIDAAVDLWKPYYGALHTTRKHTPDVHRFRVILPLTRPVSAFEYAAIWRRVFEKAGRKIDPSPKDAGRFWYLAGSADQSTFVTRRLTGKPLNPDALLAEPEPQPERVQVQRTSHADDAERRASAYLARMPEAISGSGGHAALWHAALAMVQGFGLSEDAAFWLLKAEYNPRCQPQWSDRELQHKILDAATKAQVPHGYKLDEDRDWSPRPAYSSGHATPRSRAAQVPTEAKAATSEMPKIKSIGELLEDVYNKAKTPRDRNGCPSGHGFIDVMLGGFRRGNIAVLGASTSWGKSSFAIMTTNATARAGGTVLLVSGEDPEDTFGKRIMAARARVNAISLRDHTFQDEDFDRMAKVLNDAERWPFFLNGIGKSAESLSKIISTFCEEHKPDLVIVDYLQAFSCEKRCQDRRNEVSHIARCFVDAIKTGGSAGLIFSQLKRLPPGQRPTMNDLKESGDVENMAEHVIVGYVEKDEQAPDHDEYGLEVFKRFALIEKNKDGPRVGHPIRMPWDLATACFDPITYRDYQQEIQMGR